MEKLEKIHLVLFDMLREIASLCDKYEIEYFLDSGPLLGAVRHQDFIPWDDDADIAMKRSEYEKFLKVADELPKPYLLIQPQDYGGYFFDFAPRVINMDEPLHTETKEDIAQNNYQNRMAVDIFLLDNAPDDLKAFHKMVLKQKILYGYAMAHRFNKKMHSHSLSEKLKIFILSFPGKFHSLKNILKKQECLSTAYNKKDTNYYCFTNVILKEIGNRYSKEWFDSSVKLPIRDALFTCPAGYDKTLTALYGDYMTPPPPEERYPSHID